MKRGDFIRSWNKFHDEEHGRWVFGRVRHNDGILFEVEYYATPKKSFTITLQYSKHPHVIAAIMASHEVI